MILWSLLSGFAVLGADGPTTVRIPKVGFIEKFEDRYPAVERKEFLEFSYVAPTNRVLGRTGFVNVIGAVPEPGRKRLPEGTSVVEAILASGGFHSRANASRLMVQRSGVEIRLMLQKDESAARSTPRIWYVEAEKDATSGKLKPKSGSREDFILKDGDSLEVMEARY